MAAAETTTIRVPKRTRDRLAAEARDQGVSIADLVSELAYRAWRDRAIASEIEASRLDALNPEAMAEQALWDETDDPVD